MSNATCPDTLPLEPMLSPVRRTRNVAPELKVPWPVPDMPRPLRTRFPLETVYVVVPIVTVPEVMVRE